MTDSRFPLLSQDCLLNHKAHVTDTLYEALLLETRRPKGVLVSRCTLTYIVIRAKRCSLSSQWTFETAPSSQVYVKHQSGKYLGVDGDLDYGAPIVIANQKQAWDIRADEKDPTKFKYALPKTRTSSAPTNHLLWQNQLPCSKIQRRT